MANNLFKHTTSPSPPLPTSSSCFSSSSPSSYPSNSFLLLLLLYEHPLAQMHVHEMLLILEHRAPHIDLGIGLLSFGPCGGRVPLGVVVSAHLHGLVRRASGRKENGSVSLLSFCGGLFWFSFSVRSSGKRRGDFRFFCICLDLIFIQCKGIDFLWGEIYVQGISVR